MPTKRSGDGCPIGVVAALNPGSCSVRTDASTFSCLLPPLKNGRSLDPAPGDKVVIRRRGDQFVLEEILPRRTALTRTDPRPPHAERIIAANLDLAVIVTSAASPPPRPQLIDRCLASAWRGGVQPVICLNKADLPAEEHQAEVAKIEAYRELGVPVIRTSALTGQGVEELRRTLAGKSAALIGHSGVGKSSLLNALLPGLGLRTGAVRAADGKGRHTTTAACLIAMDGGTMLFDTPGFRGFGLGRLTPAELAPCFPEFAPFASGCRFADCTHVVEPGCAVRPAVRDGQIKSARFQSYLRFLGRETGASAEAPAAFSCANCGAPVAPAGGGTKHRNHCPQCLHSRHLDRRPGDRAACCGGLMEPIAVWVRSGGEWAVIHRCRDCGQLSSNRVAADDNELLLVQLAVKPLAMPAFPLARLADGRAGSSGGA